MSDKAFLGISGIIFLLVTVLHLARLIGHWSIQVAQWQAPMWISWLGMVVAGILAVWAFSLIGRGQRPA
jgi:hypothetical protein